MKEMIIKNADGLTKFVKGEHVLTDNDVDSNGEVRVYKLDSDGDILVNARGNKVSYTLCANRLAPRDFDTSLLDDANIIEKRIIDKTFTDKKLDLAADKLDVVNSFIKTVESLRTKLKTVTNNLLGKVNELDDSVRTYNADNFNKILKQMEALSDFLKAKPMSDIQALADKIAPITKDDDFNPEDILK